MQRPQVSTLRRQFLSTIAERIGVRPGHLVVLTHLLPDRPDFLEALNSVCPIELVLSIPYSETPETLEIVKKTYRTLSPTLMELLDESYLVRAIEGIGCEGPTILLEIGGYFSKILHQTKKRLGSKFIGVIEDTEAGHRLYQGLHTLPCPVVSLARSQLKAPEDSLVGASCVHSLERLLRSNGRLLAPRRSVVLGYGKVGQGVARALRNRNCDVNVFDSDPRRCIKALSDGFAIPERAAAISSASLLLGASGANSVSFSDWPILQDGTILVSCSSKRVEFDIESFELNSQRVALGDGLDSFQIEGKEILVVNDGKPVNFRDGAVLGPTLTLVQAGLIAAVGFLFDAFDTSTGILALPTDTEIQISSLWLDSFREPNGGYYLRS